MTFDEGMVLGRNCFETSIVKRDSGLKGGEIKKVRPPKSGGRILIRVRLNVYISGRRSVWRRRELSVRRGRDAFRSNQQIAQSAR